MKVWLGLIAACLVSSSASAGDLSKRSYSRSFEWESTDCRKPSAPFVYELDSFTRSTVESYLNDVRRYRACVVGEADSDYEAFRKLMAEAIEAGRDEVLSDVDSDVEDLTAAVARAR